MKRAHPPFNSTCDGAWRRGTDFMTQRGAQRLASMIVAAWARVGVNLRVDVVPVGGHLDGMWTVRMPDLIRGLHV